MAHLITGIDIGTYSVKAVSIDAGFRRTRIADVREVRVPAGDAPLGERQLAAVRALVEGMHKETSYFVALSGERLSIRELGLPFSDPRKVAQVVPYELEGQILLPLEEVVFDHMMIATPDGAPCALAVAARSDDVGGLIKELNEAGVIPRSVFASSLVFRGRPENEAQLPVVSDEGARTDAEAGAVTEAAAPSAHLRLLLNVGHQRTDAIVLRHGQPIFARTILRGGKHLTQAIALHFSVPFELAEEVKHTRGVVGHSGYRPDDATAARLAHVLREALSPLLRELRQTLACFRSRFHAGVTHVSVVGGGARLAGLSEVLAEELGLKVSPFEPMRGAGVSDLVDPPDVRFALAEAIAWSGALGIRQIDLRRGPHVYRANFSVVRQKALHMGLLAAAILLAVIVDGAMAYSKAHRERERLEADLEEATTELFGKPDRNAATVAKLMNQGFREEMPPIPSSTAYDLLREISERVPPATDVKLDVLELDIRPRKTFIKGLIDSVASVDKVVEALKEIDCFEEIAKGAITEVAGGDKQFTLTIKATCP